jgi:predicted site-specific integrase-resolvase
MFEKQNKTKQNFFKTEKKQKYNKTYEKQNKTKLLYARNYSHKTKQKLQNQIFKMFDFFFANKNTTSVKQNG